MLTREQMRAALVPGHHKDYRPRIGFEWEMQLFARDTLAPLQMDGERGLRRVMARAMELTGAKPLPGQELKKVKLPGGDYLSLEPGGQFEYSSPPVTSFAAAKAGLDQFLGWIATLCAELDLHPFYGGLNPVHTPDAIGLVVQTPRYRRMDAYFPQVAGSGRRMMRQACSLQITYDFNDEDSGRELVRAAFCLAPFVGGWFANSPFVDGARTSWRSYRTAVWQDTDPARSGGVPGFWRPDFDFTHYLDHILRAPMFFVERDGVLHDPQLLTFEELWRRGLGSHTATLADFETHITTIFTDVRLKRTVELRSIDGQRPELLPPLMAFCSAILMHPEGRRWCIDVLGPLVADRYDEVQALLAQRGLDAAVGAGGAAALAREALAGARRWLPECLEDGAAVGGWLEPIAALFDAGETPADRVLQRCADADALLRAGG